MGDETAKTKMDKPSRKPRRQKTQDSEPEWDDAARTPGRKLDGDAPADFHNLTLDEKIKLKKQMRNSKSRNGDRNRSSSLSRRGKKSSRSAFATSMQLESFKTSAGDLMTSQKKQSCDSVEPTSKQSSYSINPSYNLKDATVKSVESKTEFPVNSSLDEKILMKKRGVQRKGSAEEIQELKKSLMRPLRSQLTASTACGIISIDDVKALTQQDESNNHVASMEKPPEDTYEMKLQRKLSSVPGVASVSKEEGDSYEKRLQRKLSSVPSARAISNTEDTFEKRLYRKMSSINEEPASTYKKEAKVKRDLPTYSTERKLPSKPSTKPGASSVYKQETNEKLDPYEKKLQQKMSSVHKIAAVSKEDVAEVEEDDGPWECFKCTFANESSTITCAVCNERKGCRTRFSLLGIPDVFNDS